MRHALMLAATALFAACASVPPPPQYHRSEAQATAGYPFSSAVQAGPWLILSGDIGLDPATGRLAPGGIEAEARRTMDNIGATLAAHGASYDDLVKCSVFLADMSEWATFNAVYREYFKIHFPARSALGTSGLALGARVEVECLAWNP
jgi:reactive intermediate/imine deaminase